MTAPDPDATLIADVFARGCTSRDVLAHVAGKWAVLALLALDEGGYRFNALRRRVEGVSEKMLAQTLQTLERDGLVAREVVTAIPPRVEYALTPLGARVAGQVRGLVELLEDACRRSSRPGTPTTRAGPTRCSRTGGTLCGDGAARPGRGAAGGTPRRRRPRRSSGVRPVGRSADRDLIGAGGRISAAAASGY